MKFYYQEPEQYERPPPRKIYVQKSKENETPHEKERN